MQFTQCIESPRAGFGARGRLALSRIYHSRATWALADQGASSLGNFATNILLARALARESFGTFGLILEAIFFLNAIQSALVTYPLSVHGASSDARTLSRYTTASLALTLLMSAPVVLVATAAGLLSGHVAVALCASAALVLWQLQETLRRAMLAHFRHRDAVWGDAISYLGQAVVILALVGAGRLTLETTFAAIALTSAAAATVQLIQVGLARVSWQEIIQRGREFIGYGKYLAANNLTVIFTTLGYSWVLTWFYGRAAVAELYAILALLKLANPVVNGVVSVLVPATARAYEQDGPRAAQRVAARYSWLGAAALIPYFLLLIAFPAPLIALFYGRGSIYADDANVLRLFVAWSALTYAVATTAAYFNAIHKSRLSLVAQAVNAGVSLLIGIPMAFAGGLIAAAAGTVFAVAAQLATLLQFLARVPVAEVPAVDGEFSEDVSMRLDLLIAARVEAPFEFRAAA